VRRQLHGGVQRFPKHDYFKISVISIISESQAGLTKLCSYPKAPFCSFIAGAKCQLTEHRDQYAGLVLDHALVSAHRFVQLSFSIERLSLVQILSMIVKPAQALHLALIRAFHAGE
jgi:hypothetical protein